MQIIIPFLCVQFTVLACFWYLLFHYACCGVMLSLVQSQGRKLWLQGAVVCLCSEPVWRLGSSLLWKCKAGRERITSLNIYICCTISAPYISLSFSSLLPPPISSFLPCQHPIYSSFSPSTFVSNPFYSSSCLSLTHSSSVYLPSTSLYTPPLPPLTHTPPLILFLSLFLFCDLGHWLTKRLHTAGL